MRLLDGHSIQLGRQQDGGGGGGGGSGGGGDGGGGRLRRGGGERDGAEQSAWHERGPPVPPKVGGGLAHKVAVRRLRPHVEVVRVRHGVGVALAALPRDGEGGAEGEGERVAPGAQKAGAQRQLIAHKDRLRFANHLSVERDDRHCVHFF